MPSSLAKSHILPTPASHTEISFLFHSQLLLPPAPVGKAGVVRLLIELLQRQLLVDPLAVGGEGDVGGKVPGLSDVQVLHVQLCILPSGEGKLTEQWLAVAAEEKYFC